MNKYLIAGAVTLLVVVGLYRYGHHKGWTERDAEMQAEIAKKNEESRQLEQRLISQVNENAKNLHEANNVIDQKQSALDRAIRAGRVRLPSASCVQAPTNPTPATPSAEDAAESDRQTLLLIAQIAADGDKAINSLNACITQYNEVREQLNGQR
jgi:septal ring factor EnvC (AmiA/AmiB activator)